jgi:hypothetical protein
LKTAAAITVAVAAAGAALAAGTGVLPNPFDNAPATTPVSTSSDPGSRTDGPTTPWGTSKPGNGPPATVSAELVGLCRAWEAQEGRPKDKVTDAPSFATLVTSAGGVEQVDAFCAAILPDDANPQGPPASVSPHPGPPSGMPSQPATNQGGQSRISEPADAGGR